MKSHTIATLMLLSLVCLPSPSAAREARDEPGEIVVTLEPGANAEAVIRRTHTEVVAHVEGSDVYALSASKARKALKALKRDKRVQTAEPNVPVRRHQTLSFPYDAPEILTDDGGAAYRGQLESGPLAEAGLRAAQNLPFSNGPIVVAVLDTGVDFDHPALAGRLWQNEAEANGSAGVDDDGDGIVDDVRGYDAISSDVDPSESSADGAVAGHGTFIAGLVTLGSLQARIMPVRVLDGQGVGTIYTAAAGIDYAVNHGAQLICMSFGIDADRENPPAVLKAAINSASAHHVGLVAASGNDGNGTPLRYPASDEDVLPAAASSGVQFASFSNDGGVIAPGDGLVSAYPGETGEDGQYHARYARWSGTSFAAAVVTAVASEMIDPAVGYFDLPIKLAFAPAFATGFVFDPSGPIFLCANVVRLRLNALDVVGGSATNDGRRTLLLYGDLEPGSAGGSAVGGVVFRTFAKASVVSRQVTAAATGLTPGATYHLVGRFGGGQPVTMADGTADTTGALSLSAMSGTGIAGPISGPVTSPDEIAILDASGATALSWSRTTGELEPFARAGLSSTAAQPGALVYYHDFTLHNGADTNRIVRIAATYMTSGAEYVARVNGVEVGRTTAAPIGDDPRPVFNIEFNPGVNGGMPIPPALQNTLDVGTIEVYRVDGAGEVLVASADLTTR